MSACCHACSVTLSRCQWPPRSPLPPFSCVFLVGFELVTGRGPPAPGSWSCRETESRTSPPTPQGRGGEPWKIPTAALTHRGIVTSIAYQLQYRRSVADRGVP